MSILLFEEGQYDESEGMDEANPPHRRPTPPIHKGGTKDAPIVVYPTKSGPRTV